MEKFYFFNIFITRKYSIKPMKQLLPNLPINLGFFSSYIAKYFIVEQIDVHIKDFQKLRIIKHHF